MKKINYIPDRALNLIEEDLLGTSSYVKLLEKVISDCPTPYTIGIFGSWGSGKSSIIKTLQNKLNETSKRFFIYDAWKYSKDDFRRTFLLELRKFFGLSIKEEEEHFYKDKVEEIKFRPKLDKLTLAIAGISLVLTLLIGRFWLNLNKIQNLMGSLSIVGLISFIFTIFRQTFIYHKVALTTSKLFAPEKFEERFDDTIKKIKNRDNKLIIAIDNIDRCHKEQVLEILLTIKNFLEKDGVIFIIPLDDNGLRNYLQMSHQDANEFIRKIFNSIIRIKNFSENDLYDFGIKLCEKYNIQFPKKEAVISMVAQEFSKNPRKIIQFLNTLQTDLYLAEIQEEEGLIPQGAITNNIEMFVKILIIREEYPELYKMIADKKSLLSEINEFVKNGKYEYEEHENGDRYYNFKEIGLKLTEEQLRFFKRTSNISLETHLLEPFFNVRDVFKDIPDEMYQLVISQDWDNIKKKIEKNEITIEKLINFIDKQLNDDVIKKGLYETTGYNLISLFFKIVNDSEIALSLLDSAKNIIAVLEDSKIWNHLFNFNPKELCNAIKLMRDSNKGDFTFRIIEKIKNIDNRQVKSEHLNLIKHFVLTFEGETISAIKEKFSELLQTNFAHYETLKEIFDTEKIKNLLTDSFAQNIIGQLTQDYNQSQTKVKVDILKSMNSHNILQQNTINDYLNRCIQFIPTLQNYQNWDWFFFWLDACKNFINKTDNLQTIQSLFNTVNQNYQFVYNHYNQRNFQPTYLNGYKVLVSVVGELCIAAYRQNQPNIIQTCKGWLNNFYNYQINQEVAKHTNEVIKSIIDKTNSNDFTDVIINNFKNQQNIENKKNIFDTIQLLFSKVSNIPEQSIKNLTDHLFNSFLNTQQEQEKKDLQDWIIKLSSNNIFLNEFVDKIKDLKDNEKLKKLLPIFENLMDKDFKTIFSKIRENLASTDSKEQETGIFLLYNLYDKQPNKFNEKKDVIKPLLNEIKQENLSKESKEQLKTLKDKF